MRRNLRPRLARTASPLPERYLSVNYVGCLVIWTAVADEPTKTNAAPDTEIYWSLKPVSRPPVPTVANRKWKPRNPIDIFLYAKLAEVKLAPSPEASRRILIRRLYFDLIGLPPTPAEVAAFEQDSSRGACEKLVDRRWPRRVTTTLGPALAGCGPLCQSHGFEMNQRPTASVPGLCRRAFNLDKPYNRFVLEQFAGDVFGVECHRVPGCRPVGPGQSPDPVLTAAQRADERMTW